MNPRSLVVSILAVAIGIAALAVGYHFTHGQPSEKELEEVHQSAEAAAKKVAELQATLPKTPPSGSIQKATANVDVTIEIPAGEKLLDDSGGYFAVAIRTQPVINPFGPDSQLTKLANRRSRWTAEWNLDPADPVINSPMKNLEHADNLQLRFNGMPQRFTVISGKSTVTLNDKLKLSFNIPAQSVRDGVIKVANISSELEPVKSAQ